MLNYLSGSPRHLATLTVITLTLLSIASCDDGHEPVRSYTVAKTDDHHGSRILAIAGDAPPSGQPPAGAAPMQAAQVGSPLDMVTWKVPEAWHRENIQRQMILAVFHADHSHDLEITVSAFPGDVGGLLANVNRWRGQIGLPPIEDAQLPDHIEVLATQGSFGGLMNTVNPESKIRTLVAVIQGGAGMSWFIKSTGPDEKVAAQKDNIIAFAESFRFVDGQAPQPAATGTDAGNMQSPILTFEQPESWKEGPISSPMIWKSFTGSSPKGESQITLSHLASDGGGLLANINRWRGQLGLEPVSSLAMQPVALLEVPDSRATLIDLTAAGDGPEVKRILMAVLETQAGTWYVKLTASSEAAGEQKEVFIEAVRSIRTGGHRHD